MKTKGKKGSKKDREALRQCAMRAGGVGEGRKSDGAGLGSGLALAGGKRTGSVPGLLPPQGLYGEIWL